MSYGEAERDVSMMDIIQTTTEHNEHSNEHSNEHNDTLVDNSVDHENTNINNDILMDERTDSFEKQQKIQQQSQESQQSGIPNQEQFQDQNQPVLIPTVFKWTEGGERVFVMGTFTGWRKMIALNGPSPKDGSFSVQIALPPGTHRFKFVVNNEVKCSNFIPTATDNSGHFVNYLEVFPTENDFNRDLNSKSKSSLRTMDSKLGLTKDDDDMGGGYSRYYGDQEENTNPSFGKEPEYITSIPAIFTDPKVMEEYYMTLDNNERKGNYAQQWLIPPQMPPHLENVILNGYSSSDKANTSGALSIPNHVVLNHLATTSIKHNTLAVASVVRYKKKYVTQILYAPLQ